MNVSIIGSGYVGLGAGACLADAGNRVLCLDVDAAKVKSRLAHAVIFDGRNLYDPAVVQGHGFEYFAIGRRT